VERLEQQQELSQRLRFAWDAFDVLVFCSPDPHAEAAAQSLADTGRKLLYVYAGGHSDAGALHDYLELQARVKAFCCGDSFITKTLASMEATLTRAAQSNCSQAG
jgi:hypothetical protein